MNTRKKDDVVALVLEMLDADAKLVMAEACPERPDYIVASKKPNFPGSKLVLCSRCGATLYMLDGFEVLRRFPDVPVLCINCAAAQARKDADAQ